MPESIDEAVHLALQAPSDDLQSSTYVGYVGTCGLSPYEGDDSAFAKKSENSQHPNMWESANKHAQPASQDVGEVFQEPGLALHDQEPQRQFSMQVQEFPFPRERVYVRTSLGIVGYLTHNDTSGCRAVRDLLGDPASEVFTSAPLQYPTWEEARAWWLEHTS